VKKLNTLQILFVGIFAATIITVTESYINWDKPLYAGIFAGVITLLVAFLSTKIIKD
jgi:uncharacterized transporter YbjL